MQRSFCCFGETRLMEAELLGGVIVFRSEMLVMLDNSENRAKVDRLERKTGDVISRSQGNRGVGSDALVVGLCHWVDTGAHAWNVEPVMLTWRIVLRHRDQCALLSQ